MILPDIVLDTETKVIDALLEHVLVMQKIKFFEFCKILVYSLSRFSDLGS